MDAHPPLLVSSVSLGFPFIAITAFLFCFHRPRADVIAYHIATNRSWQGITLREATMKGSLIMHFKQLEAFVNVIKFKSFSKAAEEIYLSQPTISAHISALESEFGTKLIIRSTKEVYPSKAGKIFYEYASEMLRMRDKAILSVKSCATDIRGTLEIAASTVPSQYLLLSFCPDGQGLSQSVFELKQYDSREVANHIINMDAEIGIVGTQLEKNKCVFEPFASDQLVLITPNLEKYRELKGDFPLSMLKKEPFILREYGSGTRKETEESLSNMGVDPKSLHLIAQMDSTESIKQAVSKGLGRLHHLPHRRRGLRPLRPASDF